MFKGGAHAEATIQTMLSLSTAASRQFADDSADGAWPTADNCELIASTVKKEEKKTVSLQQYSYFWSAIIEISIQILYCGNLTSNIVTLILLVLNGTMLMLMCTQINRHLNPNEGSQNRPVCFKPTSF